MRPLEKIYWLRLFLGIVAALVCVGYAIAANEVPQVKQGEPFPANSSLFFNSMSIAIIIYVISYYVVKHKFVTVVEKPQKIMTTGIGIYLLSWIVFWAMFYTILARPV
jgi:hypothetical protein